MFRESNEDVCKEPETTERVWGRDPKFNFFLCSAKVTTGVELKK
jgi:hypothetical protein